MLNNNIQENDNYNLNVNDFINIFRDLNKILSNTSAYEDINDISNNLLNNKIDLPHFTYNEYKMLEEEFFKIELSLKEADFNLSHDVLNYLRYLKEMIEVQVKSYNIPISVVIPTFNVERFIGDCLCSLINQSFSDFEVIVVDDCSSDSTTDIVDYYSKLDSRIKLFENSINVGSGGSRNFGLKQAKGKYVLFVDGDDWLDVNCLEKLYNLAEKHNTQTVMYKLINFEDDGTKFIKDDYLSVSCLDRFNNSLFNSNDVEPAELFEVSVVAMNKLYLRCFLMDINASFPEKYIHQDNPFFYQTFCECERIFLADEYLYNRRLWSGSITHLRDDTELGTIEIVETILKVFINNGLYDRYKEYLLNRLLFKLRNRYTLVGDSFKEEYFFRAKNKLNKFMFDFGLFDDLMECLWVENKEFFNKIIYSRDFEEFIK